MSAWDKWIGIAADVGGKAYKAYKSGQSMVPGAGPLPGGFGSSFSLPVSGGSFPRPRRRRRKGFSARDISQAKRMMKMLKEIHAIAPKPSYRRK